MPSPAVACCANDPTWVRVTVRGGDDNDDLGGGDDDTLTGGPGSDVCDGADGHGDTVDASCEQVDDVP